MISITRLHRSLVINKTSFAGQLYIEQKIIRAPRNLLSEMRHNTCTFSTREVMR